MVSVDDGEWDIGFFQYIVGLFGDLPLDIGVVVCNVAHVEDHFEVGDRLRIFVFDDPLHLFVVGRFCYRAVACVILCVGQDDDRPWFAIVATVVLTSAVDAAFCRAASGFVLPDGAARLCFFASLRNAFGRTLFCAFLASIGARL